MAFMSISCDYTVKAPEELLKKFGLEKGGRVQQAVDGAVVDFSIPYCPYRTGRLAYSPYEFTIFGSGLIEYNVPYARKMWYGIADSGKAINYNRSINPLAGSYWTERMKADRMQDIVKVAKDTMKRSRG